MTWHDNPPAPPEAIARLVHGLAPLALPKEYLEFLSASDGGEGDLTLPSHSTWLQAWAAAEVLPSNVGYAVPDRFPGLLAIGSNGGGELFALDTRRTTPGRLPIVMFPAISTDWSELIHIAPDWESFELGFGLEDPSLP